MAKNHKKPSTDPRVASAKALTAVLANESLTTALAREVQALDPKDVGLAKALAFGACRHFFSLDHLITKHLKKPFRSKDNDLRSLLIIGAYQLYHMQQPDYAATNSVVEACKKLNKEWAVNVCNAVMRKLAAAKTPKPQFEHPDWFVEKVMAAYPEHYKVIFAANNQQPPLCLRVNQQQFSQADYLSVLEEQGISASSGLLSPNSLYLDDKSINIPSLPQFDAGAVSVQDESPQLCANLLELAKGQRVLDACAAPGGKSCHILEKSPNIRELVAIDIDEKRLTRVHENLARLQLSEKAQVICADVADTQAWFDGQAFDRILCDAPCSATGVIRRHPDIKLLRTAKDIEQLAQLQLEILLSLWQCLAPNGIMLYATCSILPQENGQVIEAFLDKVSDCECLNIEFSSGLAVSHRQTGQLLGWQMLPEDQAQDGFFFAKLHKKAA